MLATVWSAVPEKELVVESFLNNLYEQPATPAFQFNVIDVDVLVDVRFVGGAVDPDNVVPVAVTAVEATVLNTASILKVYAVPAVRPVNV